MQFDVTNFATWIPIVAGVIIPFFVALIAKQNASGNLKALLAALSAALVALGMYLSDAGVHTWKGAASAFVLALVSAGASRVTLTEHQVQAVAAKTADKGVG